MRLFVIHSGVAVTSSACGTKISCFIRPPVRSGGSISSHLAQSQCKCAAMPLIGVPDDDLAALASTLQFSPNASFAQAAQIWGTLRCRTDGPACCPMPLHCAGSIFLH